MERSTGTFVLGVTKALCPECSTEFKPITCGFFDCSFRYKGEKVNGQITINGNVLNLS